MPPAAAVPERKAVGSDQNADTPESRAPSASEKATSTIASEPAEFAPSASPIPANAHEEGDQ